MKEALLYLFAAIASISIFGYSIHMFIGGFVDPDTETLIIVAGCIVAAAVMGFLAWDIIRRRNGST